MDIKLLKYRARINQAENGTLLRACIETQKREKLAYETKCQQITDMLGGRDVREERKTCRELMEAVQQLKVIDKEK